MASPDDDVQRSLKHLPFAVRRKLVEAIREQADGLADEIKARAHRKTGAMAESVQVRRGRTTLELVVTAGGETTTKPVRDGAYDYDYALGNEYGTVDMPAEPFFYPAARERQPDIEAAIEAAVTEALESA
jgi:HK97 gp10 family phage protein